MGDDRLPTPMDSRERERDRELLIPVAENPSDGADPKAAASSTPSSSHHHLAGREAFYKVIRSWASKKFMTGCVILFPIAVTFYITWWFIHFVDGFFSPIYAQLGITVFGLGFMTSITFIFLVGVFMSSWLGASVLGLGEWFIKRMPFVRHIYNASKQISAAISPDQNSQAFKEVAIIRHPRIGEYAFGFITSTVILQSYSGEEELCCVYVPTNHLYLGDMFLINSRDIIRPNLSVREGIGNLAVFISNLSMQFSLSFCLWLKRHTVAICCFKCRDRYIWGYVDAPDPVNSGCSFTKLQEPYWSEYENSLACIILPSPFLFGLSERPSLRPLAVEIGLVIFWKNCCSLRVFLL